MKAEAKRHNASTNKELLRLAEEAKSKAYAPYSGFRVGSALLADDGSVFSGCNVENGSYSLTICAERNALFQAVGSGRTRFRAIAIVSDSHSFLTPCGACRQVLAEFSPHMKIILTNGKGEVKVTTLAKLFPLPANLASLKQKRKR